MFDSNSDFMKSSTFATIILNSKAEIWESFCVTLLLNKSSFKSSSLVCDLLNCYKNGLIKISSNPNKDWERSFSISSQIVRVEFSFKRELSVSLD